MDRFAGCLGCGKLASMLGAISHEIWKLECSLNRRLLARLIPQPPCIEHRAVGGGVSLFDPRARPPSTRLVITVTTHARPDACHRLLSSIARNLDETEWREHALVLVLRDVCTADYSPVSALLEREFPGRFAYYASNEWLGKPNRYLAFQVAFDAIRRLSPQHSIFLEDDVELEPDFLQRSLAAYDAIDDPEKAVLYLCRFEDDEPTGRWVRFQRRPGPHATLTGWFDLHAFVAGMRFFEQLNFSLFRPYRSRFRYRPKWSSGVSEQFTRRLLGRGNVYQVNETLARHGREPSLLNVQARSQRPLNNFGSTTT